MIEISKLQQARIGLGVSISILLLILYIVTTINRKNTEASREEIRSALVVNKLEQISATVNRLESSQRGFVITRDTIFLTPYRQLSVTVHQCMDDLKKMVMHDPVQTRWYIRLEKLLAERIRMLESNMNVHLYSRSNFLRGNRMMTNILVQLRVMKDFEARQMERKSQHTLEWSNKSTNAVIISVLVAAVLTLIAYFILLQEYQAKVGVEQKLLLFQEQLNEKIEKLNMSNKELEQFAYVASHDLQEPLRKIITFNDRINQKFDQTLHPDVKDYLQRITKSAARMRTLIDDLLAYSRVGRSGMETSLVSLEHVINVIRDTYEVTIQSRNVSIRAGSLPSVSGDRTQLLLLFQNLISNAIKFTSPETAPVIEIKTETVAASVLSSELIQPIHRTYFRITVKDNGIGFSEKDTSRIFGIFQRLHGRSEYEGTGIGLSICEKIAKNHDGYIHAHSEPGKGSEFIVYLPAPDKNS